MKAKGLQFSAEKIKAAAKSKESTEMLLSFIAEVKSEEKKIDAKFYTKIDLGNDEPKDGDIRMSAEALLKSGKAKDKMEAILMASKEAQGAK